MKQIKHKTNKIALLIISSTIFILSGASMDEYIKRMRTLEEHFNINRDGITERLQIGLPRPLWFTNKNIIRKLINSEMRAKSVYAVVVSEGDKIFEAQKRDRNWKTIKSKGAITGDFIVKKAKLIHEEKPIGSFTIYFTKQFIKQELRHLTFYMAGKVLLMSICLSILVLFIIKVVLVKPVSELIEGMNVVGTQVNAAVKGLASVGHQMTQGANEQAAAGEQVASSLEEINAMTTINAGNSKQADTLMGTTFSVVSETVKLLQNLMTSMQEIAATGSETQKIITLIEGVAFQTNLLALNASVEAARAGKAGAGFAVVAGEVKNLAMRSSQAVKKTNTLIQVLLKKIEDGSQVFDKVNTGIEQVSQSAGQVRKLLSEVTQSSYEQSQGIRQVNTSMTDIEKVMQENAASSEEMSTTINVIAEQTGHLERFITKLTKITGNK